MATTTNLPLGATTRRPLQRFVYASVGVICLGLGGLGVVVPGLPTVIFWIIAAACFGRSCPALQQWIYRRPRIGPVIELFVTQRKITRVSKQRALIGMWFGMLISSLILVTLDRPLWIVAIIVACGAGVTWWITRGIETAEPV
ncbi:MAG: YbaN family protein [Planctomycetota bacterium]